MNRRVNEDRSNAGRLYFLNSISDSAGRFLGGFNTLDPV
jgi:hypothetical protein